MPVTIELIPDPEQGGFTARLPDIPAYGEGETEDEAIADLKEALAGYVETYGLEDALSRVSQPGLRTIEQEFRKLYHDK
jgi:predicted RNase H-like HicB family nuclease